MAIEQHLVRVLLLVLLSLLPSTTNAENYRNMSLGFSLTTQQNNSWWTSPSGDFAFGFQQIEKDGFLLAIWFNKIAERSIVWYANGQKLVGKGSKVELTSDGQFWLKDPNGQQIWNPNNEVAHVALLDTGNLVLVNQRSVIKWQSFDHPTDTILPGQILLEESDSPRLVSRYLENNFTSGRFHFHLRRDGNLVLYTQHFPLDSNNSPYWSTQALCLSQGERWSKNWTVSSITPSNICLRITGDQGSGACGFNSYCTHDEAKECHCPNGYSFIDPNDVMKGCKQDFASQGCDEAFPETHLFDMYEMQNTEWPKSEYEYYQSVDEYWCRQNCLEDCFCAAATFKGGECWKMKQPLSNGRLDSSVGGKTLIKMRKNNSTLKPDILPIKSHSSNSKLIIIGSVLLSTWVLLNLILACLAAFRNSKVRKPSQFIIGMSMNLTSYTHEELSKATNGFRQVLGHGAFATVYKGKISGVEEKFIAVKKIDTKLSGRDEEFKAEMNAIGQTNHRNLVQLIGFCDEGEHKLLVYEFMSNGSLANFLFGAQRPRWYQRKEMALEIARGLSYLHDECRTRIIHCDIKPQNILLDHDYTARISDFGLAKLLKLDQTRTATAVRGTKGYVAPEWFRNIPVSVKVDVYSYGILLLELISCKNNFHVVNAESDDLIILADLAYDSFKDGDVRALVEDEVEALDDIKKVERYVMTALWCIQEDPSLRPTMKKVSLMLQGSVDVPIPPDPTSS
ncbi:hypothetical protein VNO77_05868 [Canavalia gladiata]|uniref:Receptor-like serine/threonine-protein kinase n=1 Tax=Canavalia gladiata TaxID=3824 RepID=A0AAN9N162_CANGL